MSINKVSSTKIGGLKTHRKRPCLYCKESITDNDETRLVTDRSMGYGLIGLAHVPCIEAREGVLIEPTI